MENKLQFSQEQMEKLAGMCSESGEIVELAAIEPAAEQSAYSDSTGLVSIIAYLAGVPESHFGKEYLRTTYDELEKKTEARVIRDLCTIRNAIMKNIGSISNAMKYEMKNLDTMPEYIDPDIFPRLEAQHIRIIKGSSKDPIGNLCIVNSYISDRIGNCRSLIPVWVKFDYIRQLLNMPKGAKDSNVKSEIDRFRTNFGMFPFQCWMNWPIEKKSAMVEDPENYADDAIANVNVLKHDRRFVVLLYRNNGDEFYDFSRVSDAGTRVKEDLADFMADADETVLLVDCENSDPYRLCAVLRHLKETCLRRADGSVSDFKKLTRIILYDDPNTIDAWDILSAYTSVPIEHMEVERVCGHKSLVDIALTAGACREYYRNGIRSFLLASSDSDFWGLLRSLENCRCMVLAEKDKFAKNMADVYNSNGISYCMMDDFAGDINDIRKGALIHCLEKYMNSRVMFNFNDMLTDVYSSLRIDMSPRERDNFRSRCVESLQLTISPDGTPLFSIRQ